MDYRNSKDEQNNKDFGFGSTMEMAAKLAQMLQHRRDQSQQQGQFDKNLKAEGDRQQAGFQHDQDMVPIKTEAKNQETKFAADTELEASRARLKDVLDHTKDVPSGSGLSEGKDAAGITKPTNMGVYDLKKQQHDDQQVNKYATALKPVQEVNGAAEDLERVTNRDGKGGIFTNPNAKLVSGGKLTSAIPDSLTGLASMVGVMDSGAPEERKSIARYRQAIGVSLGGARGMSPAIQQGIQQSMGQMASDDPALMAKGLRGAGRITGTAVRTIQSGFSPEIRNIAHSNSQMADPSEFYSRIIPENGPPQNYNSAPAGADAQAMQNLHAPPKPKRQALQGMGAQPQAPAPSGGFDPDKYLGK